MSGWVLLFQTLLVHHIAIVRFVNQMYLQKSQGITPLEWVGVQKNLCYKTLLGQIGLVETQIVLYIYIECPIVKSFVL